MNALERKNAWSLAAAAKGSAARSHADSLRPVPRSLWPMSIGNVQMTQRPKSLHGHQGPQPHG